MLCFWKVTLVLLVLLVFCCRVGHGRTEHFTHKAQDCWMQQSDWAILRERHENPRSPEATCGDDCFTSLFRMLLFLLVTSWSSPGTSEHSCLHIIRLLGKCWDKWVSWFGCFPCYICPAHTSWGQVEALSYPELVSTGVNSLSWPGMWIQETSPSFSHHRKGCKTL